MQDVQQMPCATRSCISVSLAAITGWLVCRKGFSFAVLISFLLSFFMAFIGVFIAFISFMAFIATVFLTMLILTIVLYVADIYSDVKVTLLLWATENYIWASQACFLLVFQLLVIGQAVVYPVQALLVVQ